MRKVLSYLLLVVVLINSSFTLFAQSIGYIYKNYMLPIEPTKVVVDLNQIGIKGDSIDAIALFKKEKQQLATSFNIERNQLKVDCKELELFTEYHFKIFMEDGERYRVNFTTSGLPEILDNGEKQIIKVPAMPEEGFYWPYYLVIPSDSYENQNRGFKKYLMVDTINCGMTNSLEDVEKEGYKTVDKEHLQSIELAKQLSVPFILPTFPRPDVGYYDRKEGFNWLYTHALDRDSALLHSKLKNSSIAEELKSEFVKLGLNPSHFEHLDRQVIAMADHAVKYLNSYNQGVETDKFFLYGYSASGTFTDRLATLHPTRIKAVASGATLDDMILPVEDYQGEELIFPIGVSDYQEITGRAFSLSDHNNVARLLFMGKEDDNNTLPYSDCYGDEERRIITKLFGTEVLPRAEKLIELYGEFGGSGIFILDKDIKHSLSREMNEYVLEFFKANRNSDRPVYPEVKATNQLIATLYNPDMGEPGQPSNPDEVLVSIPPYDVVVNGVTIDNKHHQYPMLSYKNITYVPMTWNYTQALGLSIDFNLVDGLKIAQSGTDAPVQQDLGANNDFNTMYSAVIPSYDIYVNGRWIDNTTQEYPILNFRDITYFPLTWEFAVTEFGWNLNFDEQSGFIINSSIHYLSDTDLPEVPEVPELPGIPENSDILCGIGI